MAAAGSRQRGSRPAAGAAAVRVRSARRRKPSSTEWLTRQLNDPYVAEARRQGYRSRAAFKLIELDERFHLLRPRPPGRRSRLRAGRLDARSRSSASAPARAGRRRSTSPTTAPIAGATLLRADFRDPARRRRSARRSAAGRSRAERHGGAGDRPCRDRPSARSSRSPRRHSTVAETVLEPGGAFVAKVFQGGAEGELLGRAEACLRRGAPRQAAGEPRRIGRRPMSSPKGFAGRIAAHIRGRWRWPCFAGTACAGV